MAGARAIVYSRIRILRNSAAGLKNEPPLKILFIAAMTIAFWIGALFLFHRGLSFFYVLPIVGPVLVDEALYLFFAVLFVMLFLSALIVCHTTFFNSGEVSFLFSRPLGHGTVLFSRLLQSAFFSSWAFLFLGVPFLIAYALVKGVPVWFYWAIPAWFGAFIILPTALASLVVLVLVRHIDYGTVKYYFFSAIAVAALALYWHYRTAIAPEARAGGDITVFMDTFLYHLRLLKHPLYPGYWMASSVVQAGAGRAGEALFYFFIYGMTSLMALQVNHWASRTLFYQSWLASRNRSKRLVAAPDRGIARGLTGLLLFLPRPTTALLVKDVKLFLRDFGQYSQFLVYLAILGVYIFNLGTMPVSVDNPYWKLIVTFLNFTATALVLAGFTVRFIFPQMSLEGNKIWMLGLAPLTFRRLVLQKFFFHLVPLLLISTALMTATNLMIETSRSLFFISCSLAVLSSIGLTGLAVGLGSLYPNFREENPARIVSGFGGTLNFIIALAYVLLLALAFAVPYFLYEVHHAVTEEQFRLLLGAAWTAVIGATAAAALAPMAAGYRNLERTEF